MIRFIEFNIPLLNLRSKCVILSDVLRGLLGHGYILTLNRLCLCFDDD